MKTFRLNNKGPKASVINTDARPQVFKKTDGYLEKNNFQKKKLNKNEA